MVNKHAVPTLCSGMGFFGQSVKYCSVYGFSWLLCAQVCVPQMSQLRSFRTVVDVRVDPLSDSLVIELQLAQETTLTSQLRSPKGAFLPPPLLASCASSL